MIPAYPSNNKPDRSIRDSEHICYVLVTVALEAQLTYFSNYFIGKLAIMMLLATLRIFGTAITLSSARSSVIEVSLIRSEIQMLWINAKRNVAVVAYQPTFRDSPVNNGPRHPMNKLVSVLAFSFLDSSIKQLPGTKGRSGPEPAGWSLVDPAPKPSRLFWSERYPKALTDHSCHFSKGYGYS